MNDLTPDATVEQATDWLTENVPTRVLAGLITASLSCTGQSTNDHAVDRWVQHSPEQVRQFEDWSIAQRMNTWVDGSPT